MSATQTAPTDLGYNEVPTDQIRPAPDNPRTDLGDLTELTASIKASGILEPLIVMPAKADDDDLSYQLVAGARRLAAAQAADLEMVPVVVVEMTDTQRREAMLIENLQRQDLNPIEEARGIAQVVELGHKQKDVATRIGVNPSHVSRRLSLLELPEPIQDKVASGKANVHDAEQLARLHRIDPERAAVVAQGQPSSWQWKVDNELEAIERDKERAARRKELSAAGVRVLEPGEDIGEGWLTVGVIAVRMDLPDEKHDDFVEAHASEPCHVVEWPQHGYMSERAWCTDPARHGIEVDTSDVVLEAPPSERDIRIERAKEREPFYRALLDRQAHDDAKNLIIGAVAFGVVDDVFYGGNQETVERWLGIEESDEDDPSVLLEQIAAESDRARFRVALAITLAELNASIVRGTPPELLIAEHDRLLASVGYELPVPEPEAEPEQEVAAS